MEQIFFKVGGVYEGTGTRGERISIRITGTHEDMIYYEHTEGSFEIDFLKHKSNSGSFRNISPFAKRLTQID